MMKQVTIKQSYLITRYTKIQATPQGGVLLITKFVIQDTSANSSEDNLAFSDLQKLHRGREIGAWYWKKVNFV